MRVRLAEQQLRQDSMRHYFKSSSKKRRQSSRPTIKTFRLSTNLLSTAINSDFCAAQSPTPLPTPHRQLSMPHRQLLFSPIHPWVPPPLAPIAKMEIGNPMENLKKLNFRSLSFAIFAALFR
jgi:hypothetical protein